jgi:S1-C subfamily serine protease
MEDAPSGGVLITAVAPGSPAASAGLEPGDVITGMGNQQVNRVADVNAALNGLVAGNSVQIQFGRGPAAYSTLATLAVQPHGGP